MGFFGNLNAEKYDRQYDDGYLIRRIFNYVRPYRRQFIAILVAVSVLSVSSSLNSIFIAAGIDALEESVANTLLLIIVALFLATCVDYAMNWMRRRLLTRMLGGMVSQMRKDAFNAALDRDMAFYDHNKTGKIVSRITGDTQEFGDVLLFTSDVISQLVSVLFLLVILLQRSPILTLVLLLMMPIFAMTAIGFRQLARRVTRQGSRAMAVVNDNIQESVTGISVAKNFRRENMIYEEFVAVNTLSYQTNMRRGFVLAAVFPVLNFLTGFAIGVMMFSGADFVLRDVITAGTWFLFITGVDRFLFPIINLASFWSQIQQGLSASERIFALIDADNTVIQKDTQPVQALQGHILFKEVNFGYSDDALVLKNFHLDIQPGESVAFVGHTGAGKSTIAKLVTRFYEFQSGTILIDGRDIRTVDLQSYRRHLGLVPQQPFLFSGTILENIRYARPEATDEEIREIAYSVGNGEWLDTLPDGLNTDVGERGARLSMGQRQLVSLLRVLVQKPSIFILDEATASVDPFTEMQIQEAIEQILARSTSILIAHRLSTVQSADRIIVLKEGAIIEEGSHDSLMQQGGHYAELYNTYFRHQSLSYIENARDMLREPAGD
jgi:ATP-binding cassette subfamily B protein